MPSFTFTHTDTSRKKFSYCIYRFFTLWEPKLSLRTNSQNLRPSTISPISLSLSILLQQTTWLELPGAAEKVRHLAKIALATDLTPSPCPSKFYLFVLYRSIDLFPKTILLQLPLTIWSPFSHQQHCLLSPPHSLVHPNPLSFCDRPPSIRHSIKSLAS